MFSILQKTNLIKTQNKTMIIFIVGSIIYVLIHYIIFNEYFDNLELIQFIRPGFYIAFVVDFVLFIKMITEEKLNKEIESSKQERENVEIYYGGIIKQLTDNLQMVNQPQEQNQQTKEIQEIQKPINQEIEKNIETSTNPITNTNISSQENKENIETPLENNT